MARTANLNIVKHIGSQGIFEDLAHLPDEEAIRKSMFRERNQRAAQRRKDGTVGERKPRGAGRSRIARAGAMPIPEEAKPIMARHQAEIAGHETAHRQMLERHDTELEEVRKLIAAIALADAIDPKLSKPMRDRLAGIK